MTKAIVTVKRVEEARVRDLELPVDIPSAHLAEMVATALGWNTDATGRPVSYHIEAHPPGRLLLPSETLAQAGAWDGSWLVFHPENAVSASPPSAATRSAIAAPSPPLQPVAPETTHTSSQGGSGFVWKQIDED
ncbi:MAG: EsaB/YukD family protein [Anaerolineae bacterium]|nr:EsaB/YukD family protein [Anaerolineae bacterium]